MALDKVIDSAVLDADLLAVADAIRAKGGISEQLVFPEGFVEAIEAISAGGGSDYESGTLVLDVNSNKISIPTTKKYTHVAIWYPTTELPEGWTKYQSLALLGIEGCYLVEGYINYNATNFSGALKTAPSYDPVNGPYLAFNESSIDVISRTSGSSLQVFVAGAEYKWTAW